MSKMTVYAQSNCNACREIIPILERLTSGKGIAMEVIDVDKCHTKKCDDVKFTPTIILNGREVKSARELKRMLGAKARVKPSKRRK